MTDIQVRHIKCEMYFVNTILLHVLIYFQGHLQNCHWEMNRVNEKCSTKMIIANKPRVLYNTLATN